MTVFIKQEINVTKLIFLTTVNQLFIRQKTD